MPEDVVTLQIDGRDVSATAQQKLLQVARENGVKIPTLCFLEGLSIYGGCRLCLVEVEGSNKLVPACTTSVAEGMKIVTSSPRLQKYRKMIVEMLLSERNHICSVCVSNGNCELQWLAQNLGVDHIRFSYLYPDAPVDAEPRPFCARPEPLCSVYALRAGLRRNRRRAHLGRDGTRYCIAGDHRSGRAMGRIAELHQLRQMRQRLPHRRAES